MKSAVIKQFTALAQLGFSTKQTVATIAAAMPDNSIFIAQGDSVIDSSDLPAITWGDIVITKINSARWHAKWYTQNSNDRYYEFGRSGNSSNGSITSWKTVYSD